MTSVAALDPRKKAWRGALTVSALVLIGSILAITTWQSTVAVPIPHWEHYVSAYVSLASVLLLLSFRKMPIAASHTIFVANLLVTLFADTIINVMLAGTGVAFLPFIGNKYVAFAVAILAPMPVHLGFAMIALSVVVPFFEYFVLIPAEFRRNVITPEPWVSLMWAIIALAVYRHRIKEAQYEREMAKALEEKHIAEERARNFLAIRDLTNSPLQTIAFTIALLRRKHPEADGMTAVLQAGYDKLRELSELLETYEADSRNGPASFDPRRVLERAREREAK